MQDRVSMPCLAGVRLCRSAAAGLINLAFPYLVLVELHSSTAHGALLLGLIYTAGTLSTAAFGLLLGFSADLIGRKMTLLIALVLLPLGTSVLYVSSGYLPLIFVAAALGGFSSTGSLSGGGVGGAAMPIQSVIVADITSRSGRTFYYSLLSFLAGVAAAGGALLAGITTISEAVLLATAFGAASVFLALFIRTREPGGRSPTETAERGGPRRPRLPRLKSGANILKFVATGMLNGLSQGLVTPFLIPFFIIVYGVSRGEMSGYATISGVIGAFVLLLAPRAERLLGFLRSIMLTRGASAVLMLVMGLVRLFPVSLAIYLTIPALRSIGRPIQQTAMVDMVEVDERGRAFGINQTMRLGASSAGVAFAGYEFDASAIEVPFLLYAAILGANVLLYRVFFSDYRAPTGQDGQQDS